MITCDYLTRNGVLKDYPGHLKNSIQYEVIVGSRAYGVSSDNSDTDIYGFSIPPKNIVFPHLSGEIAGFGTQKKRFEQFQTHYTQDELSYDITIYSIVKYFQLCMQNNPNMIDSLFVPVRCIIHTTSVGNLVRENRKLFLHKGCWYKFKGYAYSQVHKMNIKTPDPSSVRYESIKKYGYDVKFAYHVVRLLNEVEQILIEHDLDLERNREQLKSVRRGEWTMSQILKYFSNKEESLEKVYTESSLRYSPDESRIKKLLLESLEMYYGTIDNAIKYDISVPEVLHDIEQYIQKLKRKEYIE
jgi:uncharacterized protein